MPLAFNSNNAVSRHFSTKSPIGLSAKTYTTVMIRIKTLQQQKQSRGLKANMIITRFEDEDRIERVVAANGMTSKEHKLFFAQITVC